MEWSLKTYNWPFPNSTSLDSPIPLGLIMTRSLRHFFWVEFGHGTSGPLIFSLRLDQEGDRDVDVHPRPQFYFKPEGGDEKHGTG